MTIADLISDKRLSDCNVYDDHRAMEYGEIKYRGVPTELCKRKYGCVLDLVCDTYYDRDSFCVEVFVSEAADGDLLDAEYLSNKLFRFVRDMHGWNDGYSLDELFEMA